MAGTRDAMDSEPLLDKRRETAVRDDLTVWNHQVRCPHHYKRLRFVLTLGVLILCLNIAVLMAILYLLKHPGLIGNPAATLSPFSHQPFVPDFGFKTYYFGDDNEDYARVMEQDNLTAWEELFWMDVPPGGGYHRVPNAQQLGLPSSEPVANSTEREEMYLTTFAHQLHCIGVLREALLSDAGRQTEYHVYHCLEKLRRGVICAGDTTSEGATVEVSEDGRTHWSFDDWRQPHQCRDTEAIQAWMWEHRAR